MDERMVEEARAFARSSCGEALDLLRELERIPAPTRQEGRRAAFVRAWLASKGARDVSIDDAGNVVCPIGPTTRRGPLTVFSAHTDVAFPDTDELPLEEDEERLWAPGAGDDTANLVAMLMGTSWLLAHEDELAQGVVVVANACEEGLGNLDGTKRLYQELGMRIERHVAFDLYLPQVISSAVGSHRFLVAADGPGGHSWADAGRPSAIETLCSIVSDLADLEAHPLPDAARTTQNVGTIAGGTTVNAIAGHAEMRYEYRSTSEPCLERMHDRLEAVLEAHRTPEMRISCQTIGIRPGNGEVDEEALGRLEGLAADAVRAITGLEPDRSPASTDANVPLSLGIPAVCVGAVRGAGLHTRREWVEKASLVDGIGLACILMRTLSCETPRS